MCRRFGSLLYLFARLPFRLVVHLFVCAFTVFDVWLCSTSPPAETRLTVYRRLSMKSNTESDRASSSSAAASDNRYN